MNRNRKRGKDDARPTDDELHVQCKTKRAFSYLLGAGRASASKPVNRSPCHRRLFTSLLYLPKVHVLAPSSLCSISVDRTRCDGCEVMAIESQEADSDSSLSFPSQMFFFPSAKLLFFFFAYFPSLFSFSVFFHGFLWLLFRSYWLFLAIISVCWSFPDCCVMEIHLIRPVIARQRPLESGRVASTYIQYIYTLS